MGFKSVENTRLTLKEASIFEIVEAADGINESIDHDLGVAAALGGVDAVVGIEFTERF